MDGKYGRNKSMAELARISVGRTKTGIQVWCVRHEMNITHIDLSSDHPLMNMPLVCGICSGPECEHAA